MTIEQGMELGISIRGGAEHGLAIYVSAVDPASLADLHGIEVLFSIIWPFMIILSY